jgi:hypothetical protein
VLRILQISNLDNDARITKVKEGIDFILSHFDERQQLFPRKISTAFSNGRQFTVYSREQILEECFKSNFINCRINAYPVLGKNQHQSPNIIFIDLYLSKDLPYQQALKKLERTKDKSIKLIKEKLNGCKLTVLWTGNGYHIYIVLNTRPLELIKELRDLSPKPSEEFLKYAGITFSNNKKDSAHNPSFRSSLLRVPYMFNSKNMEEVKVIQEFDEENIISINSELLRGFRLWLVDNDLTHKQKQLNCLKYRKDDSTEENRTILNCCWIEKLLQTPIPCFRRYCLYRILVPYLVNVKRLSYTECFDISCNWLEKCNSIFKLSFDKERESKLRLNSVKNYLPLSIKKLRNENVELYNLIFTN